MKKINADHTSLVRLRAGYLALRQTKMHAVHRVINLTVRGHRTVYLGEGYLFIG